MEIVDWTPDRIESELIRLEGLIGQARAAQAVLIDEADRRRMPTNDAARSLADWISARLDVTHSTAHDLIALARSGDVDDLESGTLSTDRAVARRRLGTAGASKEVLAYSDMLDLAGVRRLTAHHRRHTPTHERDAHNQRSLVFEPDADGTTTRFWGRLAGTDATAVAEALTHLGDQLAHPPDGHGSRAQRNADALVALCLGPTVSDTAEPTAVVIVDARLAAPTDGTAGVTVLGGPRLGPQALEEILCAGTTEIVALTTDGTPLGIGTRSSKVPPRLRRYVLARDGACTAEGCASQYRLQPHHILPAADHGPTEAENLVTLCWWHHHIVIHGRGYHIDPDSPPGRVRFQPPDPTPTRQAP